MEIEEAIRTRILSGSDFSGIKVYPGRRPEADRVLPVVEVEVSSLEGDCLLDGADPKSIATVLVRIVAPTLKQAEALSKAARSLLLVEWSISGFSVDSSLGGTERDYRDPLPDGSDSANFVVESEFTVSYTFTQ